MKILNKEFVKYTGPMFFSFGRVLAYLLVVILILGAYSSTGDVGPSVIHFWLMLAIAVLGLAYDAINVIRKARTYQNHKVQFSDEYILIVDHLGVFKLPYDEVKSYQLISNQILIRTKWNRFVISGKLYGINYDELKEIVDFLSDKEVLSKSSNTFIYFLVAFIAVNYGAQYIFVDVFGIPVESTVFYIFYLVFFIAMAVIGFEKYQLSTLKMKEDK